MTKPNRLPLACEVVGANRPHPSCTVSGDAWQVVRSTTAVTTLVVDGVGHGPEAERASLQVASLVLGALADSPEQPLGVLLERCHVALRGTRGAAVAVLRIQLEARVVEFCGVGNVTLQAAPRRDGLGVSMPGTVGYRMRKPVVFMSSLEPGDTFSLHTDGIGSGFDLAAVVHLPVERAARETIERFGKQHDDATVVLVRCDPAVESRALSGSGIPS